MSAAAGSPDADFYLVSISGEQNLRPSVVWLESQSSALENQSPSRATPWPQQAEQNTASTGTAGCIEKLLKSLADLPQTQSREAFSSFAVAEGKALPGG